MGKIDPRMARKFIEYMEAEGEDINEKKLESLDAALEALIKQSVVKPTPIEPMERTVRYTISCPLCCRILTDRSYYCDNCGQAIYQPKQ